MHTRLFRYKILYICGGGGGVLNRPHRAIPFEILVVSECMQGGGLAKKCREGGLRKRICRVGAKNMNV